MEDEDRNPLAEASRIELQEIASGDRGDSLLGRKIDLIRDVQVSADVLLGRADMTAGKLFDLRKNDVLELDARLTDPVTIRVAGKAIGKGEIVVVGDHFGVLITELADG